MALVIRAVLESLTAVLRSSSICFRGSKGLRNRPVAVAQLDF